MWKTSNTLSLSFYVFFFLICIFTAGYWALGTSACQRIYQVHLGVRTEHNCHVEVYQAEWFRSAHHSCAVKV